MDGTELENLPNTLAHAISHAFAQPDEDFLTNGGALPIVSGAAAQEAAGHSRSPGLSNILHGPNEEFVMSGALPVSPDAETQTPTSSSEHDTPDGFGFTSYMRNWPFGLGS